MQQIVLRSWFCYIFENRWFSTVKFYNYHICSNMVYPGMNLVVQKSTSNQFE